MRIDVDLLRDRLPVRASSDLDGPEVKKRAAVAAIVRDSGAGAEVLLIRRAERSGDPWSGQMAFPGGRFEPRDADLAETARREALEEIGLQLADHGRVIGRLDDVRTHTGDMIVRPYVWSLDRPVVLSPNHEVAEIVWGNLSSMASGAVDAHYEWPGGASSMRFPAYRVGEHVVWGLTHRILGTLFGALR